MKKFSTRQQIEEKMVGLTVDLMWKKLFTKRQKMRIFWSVEVCHLLEMFGKNYPPRVSELKISTETFFEQ